MSTADIDPGTFLMGGGGGRSAKFPNVGDKIDGEVISAEVTQQTDFKTGAPKTWDDGSPMRQLVVTLQTTEHEDDDDDGVRRLFAKGSPMKPTTSLGAIRAAVHAVGATNLEPGGRLQVAYTGDGVASGAGLNPPKEYKAKYGRPTGGVDVNDIFPS
jgi:hypothetical protein